jgi:hypothetical protein
MALANQVAIIGTGTMRFEESALGAMPVQNHLVSKCRRPAPGRGGRMQVAGARTGLAHTLGGSGAVSRVAVLGQP